MVSFHHGPAKTEPVPNLYIERIDHAVLGVNGNQVRIGPDAPEDEVLREGLVEIKLFRIYAHLPKQPPALQATH